ncbi:MAG: ABC transporter permease DevC [Calothrix sp. MO_167.B12]|nr:ABC transporter permease DevC [Calothrix sp. MO_167.B12]
MFQKWLRKIPLTWQQLMKDKTRFLVALAGIAFADILIFVQTGFESALFESSTAPHRNLNADLFIVNSHFETVYAKLNFPQQRLYQTRGFAGVKSVTPLHIAFGTWKNPQTRRNQRILVFGINPAHRAFQFPEVNQNRHQLQNINSILFDRNSLPEFGPIPSLLQQQSTVAAELNNKKVRVSGLYSLGVSFAAYGNVITSDSSFLRLFPYRNPNKVEVGLIKLQPNADIESVARNLRAALPEDVTVLTKDIFIKMEESYWSQTSPIGFIFALGVIVSFIVGIVIVYQILYSDVSDHLKEYVTLKAMGYSDRFLLIILAQEALFLAVLGYMPGLLLTFGLYNVTAAATMLPIYMTVERGVIVLIITISMCFISGAIAMKKLRSADPADLLY